VLLSGGVYDLLPAGSGRLVCAQSLRRTA